MKVSVWDGANLWSFVVTSMMMFNITWWQMVRLCHWWLVAKRSPKPNVVLCTRGI